MSKKSKKYKKQISLPLSADKIEYLLTNKYDMDDEGFWLWFFEETEKGGTNILCLDQKEPIPEKFVFYINIIRDEFSKDVDSENCLEIENDL